MFSADHAAGGAAPDESHKRALEALNLWQSDDYAKVAGCTYTLRGMHEMLTRLCSADAPSMIQAVGLRLEDCSTPTSSVKGTAAAYHTHSLLTTMAREAERDPTELKLASDVESLALHVANRIRVYCGSLDGSAPPAQATDEDGSIKLRLFHEVSAFFHEHALTICSAVGKSHVMAPERIMYRQHRRCAPDPGYRVGAWFCVDCEGPHKWESEHPPHYKNVGETRVTYLKCSPKPLTRLQTDAGQNAIEHRERFGFHFASDELVSVVRRLCYKKLTDFYLSESCANAICTDVATTIVTYGEFEHKDETGVPPCVYVFHNGLVCVAGGDEGSSSQPTAGAPPFTFIEHGEPIPPHVSDRTSSGSFPCSFDYEYTCDRLMGPHQANLVPCRHNEWPFQEAQGGTHRVVTLETQAATLFELDYGTRRINHCQRWSGAYAYTHVAFTLWPLFMQNACISRQFHRGVLNYGRSGVGKSTHISECFPYVQEIAKLNVGADFNRSFPLQLACRTSDRRTVHKAWIVEEGVDRNGRMPYGEELLKTLMDQGKGHVGIELKGDKAFSEPATSIVITNTNERPAAGGYPCVREFHRRMVGYDFAHDIPYEDPALLTAVLHNMGTTIMLASVCARWMTRRYHTINNPRLDCPVLREASVRTLDGYARCARPTSFTVLLEAASRPEGAEVDGQTWRVHPDLRCTVDELWDAAQEWQQRQEQGQAQQASRSDFERSLRCTGSVTFVARGQLRGIGVGPALPERPLRKFVDDACRDARDVHDYGPACEMAMRSEPMVGVFQRNHNAMLRGMTYTLLSLHRPNQQEAFRRALACQQQGGRRPRVRSVGSSMEEEEEEEGSGSSSSGSSGGGGIHVEATDVIDLFILLTRERVLVEPERLIGMLQAVGAACDGLRKVLVRGAGGGAVAQEEAAAAVDETSASSYDDLADDLLSEESSRLDSWAAQRGSV